MVPCNHELQDRADGMTESNRDVERLIALLADRSIATESFDADDWLRIVGQAQKHVVLPMLYSRLRERQLTLPPAVAEPLHELCVVSLKRNMHLLFELRRILPAFQAEGIDVIPLKGAFLAVELYGNIARRQLGDLDLLVRPTDLSKALDVLNSLGYFSKVPFDIESERQLSQHMPQVSNGAQVQLDLHWTISSPWVDIPFDDSDLEGIWDRALPFTLSGVNVLQLSPVDLLLYLTMHAAVQHRFDGIALRNFWDMALLIRHYDAGLDWEQFMTRVKQWRIANGVHVVFQLVQEWTDTPIPPSVMHALSPTTPNRAALEMVKRRILGGGAVPLSVEDERVQGQARFGDILIAVRNVLFPSRHVLAQEYQVPADSWRIPFYYLVRVKDLWARNPRAVWQVLGRDKKLIEMQQELDLREYLD